MDNPSLSDNLVQDLAGIALHLFGKDDPGTIRKVRHLIARYGLPVVKRGRYIWSFTDWLDSWARGKTGHGAGQ
jgi:hypothetical protein